MWVVAGVLLGLVALFSLLGFHTGPHSHVVAGSLGALAAVWLIVMGATGNSSAILWTLLSADVVVSAGAGVVAMKGLHGIEEGSSSSHMARIEGKFGTAMSDLSPDGIVRVNGESWSATSLNGDHPSGTPVQVVSGTGVRLEVWGDASVLDTAPTEIAPQSSEPRTGP